MKTKTPIARLLLLSLCLWLLFACKSTPKQPINSSITDKYWKLTELNGEEIFFQDSFRKEPHFILRSDNKLSGHGSCNTFAGSYEIKEKNSITIPPLISTMIACPNMEIEFAFLGILEQVDNFSISADGKFLSLKNGKVTLARFVVVYLE